MSRDQRPQLDDFEGDWNKWAAYVLNSIHELKYDIERIFDLLSSKDLRREQDCPFKHRIQTLEYRQAEQGREVQKINLTIAKWSGAIIVINGLIGVAIAIIMRSL